METKYITLNNKVSIRSFSDINSALAPGNYAVNFSMSEGYFLEKREPFDLPVKIYGKSNFPERIANAYTKLNRGMGVLLSGEKGTGKTIDAKLTCELLKIPVLIVNSNFVGTPFSEFLESIKTPCIVFLDEFEKVYAQEEERQFFLSIMDGTSKSRHLFLLTSNSNYIGEYFSNRPNRVRYHKTYNFLTTEVMEEIINDKLEDKSKKAVILNSLKSIPAISMDSFCSIIEECNIFNELPKDFISFFNVKTARRDKFSVEIIKNVLVPKSPDVGITYTEHVLFFNTGTSDEQKAKILEKATPDRKTIKGKYANVSIEDCEVSGELLQMYISGWTNDGIEISETINLKRARKFEEDNNGFYVIDSAGNEYKGIPIVSFHQMSL